MVLKKENKVKTNLKLISVGSVSSVGRIGGGSKNNKKESHNN